MTTRAARHALKVGQCFARGPSGGQCTDLAGHNYAHYDETEDTSWTDRLEDHPAACRCDLHRPDLYEGARP